MHRSLLKSYITELVIPQGWSNWVKKTPLAQREKVNKIVPLYDQNLSETYRKDAQMLMVRKVHRTVP